MRESCDDFKNNICYNIQSMTESSTSIAVEMLGRYEQLVQHVEDDLTMTVNELGTGAYLEGLDFKLKSADSLARKLELRKIRDKADAFKAIRDVMRFTIVIPTHKAYSWRNIISTNERGAITEIKLELGDVIVKEDDTGLTVSSPDNFVQAVRHIGRSLKKKNYRLMKVNNAFACDDAYNGLNTQWRVKAGEDNLWFELQFHTLHSYASKTENHAEYEQARRAGISKDEKEKLTGAMVRVADVGSLCDHPKMLSIWPAHPRATLLRRLRGR